MELVDERYEKFFDHFENFTGPIIDEDFNDSNNEVNEDAIKLSKILKRYLSNHCDYSVDVVLQADTTKHGFEMWRRLQDHFEPRSFLTAVGRLAKALVFKFRTETLEKDLAAFEHEISQIEIESEQKIIDIIKIGILINGTSGSLNEWLRLNGGSQKDWSVIRANVISYARSQSFTLQSVPPITSSSSSVDPVPMQIDAIRYSKGGKAKRKRKREVDDLLQLRCEWPHCEGLYFASLVDFDTFDAARPSDEHVFE